MKTLVIGAGPVGLTAALEFAAHGINCRIVERRTGPSNLSRAVGIMPETIEKLRRIGAGEAIEAEGMLLGKLTLKRGTKVLLKIDNPKPGSREKRMVGLPQNRTEEILRDALHERGIHVEYGLSVEKISTTDDTASVAFSDGSTADYDWVIAADGIGSTVREQLDIAYPGIDLPGEWSIADVDVSGPFDEENVTTYCQGPGNVFVMVLPIERRRVRIVSSTTDALAAMPEKIEIQNIRRTGTFKISIRQAETYKQGRVLLAGDAAHCHSPVGGRGMNLGIDDAIAAVHAIVNGETEHYTEQRHAIGAEIMKQSELMRKLIISNNWLVQAVTTVALKMISSLPFARRAIMRKLTRLGH